MMPRLPLLLPALLAFAASPARAQDGYEIQVYPSETMARGRTMFELHTNFTADGLRVGSGTAVASHHALHETVEITHGFNDWFEVGFYTFFSRQPGDGPEYVGNHIRPRIRVPLSAHWPVGVSLSSEVGWARTRFTENAWSWEIRPIMDKQMGRFYWSLNPVLDVALSGPGAGGAPDFAPNAAATFDVTGKVNVGVEYYAAWGPISGLDAPSQRQQQVFAVTNLDLDPNLEFNAGVGFGIGAASDKLVLKLILGYRR